ncbi:RNA polymerase Rpb4-domain-containing protein [Mycena olivaceomarginata]|nr:RNA polymerase Rpb4-domain-containing protein [Mycena olivaceomarginata]
MEAPLLSNYEVAPHKKEEEAAGLNSTVPTGGGKDPTVVEVSENLRTVSFEAIQYLSSEYQATASQTPEAITQLVKSLEPYGLTKAEKLQIVNLAPQHHIELYVIVEELEDRLAERMGEVISHVQESLVVDPALAPISHATAVQNKISDEGEQWGIDEEYVEEVYDDQGEGAGVEGDLDMDDD